MIWPEQLPAAPGRQNFIPNYRLLQIVRLARLLQTPVCTTHENHLRTMETDMKRTLIIALAGLFFSLPASAKVYNLTNRGLVFEQTTKHHLGVDRNTRVTLNQTLRLAPGQRAAFVMRDDGSKLIQGQGSVVEVGSRAIKSGPNAGKRLVLVEVKRDASRKFAIGFGKTSSSGSVIGLNYLANVKLAGK
jgi:hypothetical protein